MAAPPRTPQSPPARLGKDKESWDVLLVEERAAAEKLGWTPESWEHGDPPVCSSAWEMLDAEQRAAATALGYERLIWDVEYEVDQPHTPGKDKEYWCLLTLHEKHAAAALGYERCSWDQGWHVEKTTTPWAALNQWNRTDAADLGYTPELWDAEIEGEIGAVPIMPTTTLKMRALDSGLSSSLAGASSCEGFDGGASPDTRHGLNAPLPILDLPLELADHIFAQLGLLELSRVVAVSRFCHSRLPAAITACSLRLRLGGYATANGLKSTSKLLAHLDTALPRLPRVIVVTWLGDLDWRVRLAGLKALSLRGGGGSTGDSAGVSEQHGAAIAALQEDLEPAVSSLARSLLARIAPMRLTCPPLRAPEDSSGSEEEGGDEDEVEELAQLLSSGSEAEGGLSLDGEDQELEQL